jgi:GTP-binding protein HflX
VLNKVDRLSEDAADAASLERRLLGHSDHRAVAISAVTGDGIPDLLAVIDQTLPLDPIVRTTLDLSASDGASLALLHEFGRVLETRYTGERVQVEAEIPESLQRRLRQR